MAPIDPEWFGALEPMIMTAAYLESLPPDTASHVAVNRVIGAAEAAAFCNISLPHWRRLYRAGKVPRPVKLSARKLGWKLSTLIAFNSGTGGGG